MALFLSLLTEETEHNLTSTEKNSHFKDEMIGNTINEDIVRGKWIAVSYLRPLKGDDL